MNVPFERAVMPGLSMRLFQMEDAAAVFSSVERNREYLREWLPWVDATKTEADIRQFIERVQRQWEAGQGPQCSIWSAGDLIGCIGVHPIDWSNRNCSLGYWLDAGREGRGIMTQCCGAMLDYLLLEHGLHRVEIRCGTGNRRSCAIPERLGFTRDGVLRQAQWVNDRWVDLEVWSLLQREWNRFSRRRK